MSSTKFITYIPNFAIIPTHIELLPEFGRFKNTGEKITAILFHTSGDQSRLADYAYENYVSIMNDMRYTAPECMTKADPRFMPQDLQSILKHSCYCKDDIICAFFDAAEYYYYVKRWLYITAGINV